MVKKTSFVFFSNKLITAVWEENKFCTTSTVLLVIHSEIQQVPDAQCYVMLDFKNGKLGYITHQTTGMLLNLS